MIHNRFVSWLGFTKNLRKGQSLFEVIFAIAIAGLMLTGVVALATTSVRNTTSSKNKNLTSNYLTKTTEWLRQQRDSDWTILASRTGNTYCITDPDLDDTSWPGVSVCGSADYITDTKLLREVALSYEDAENRIIQANIEIRWTDAQGTHVDRSVARFTNWKIYAFVTPTPIPVAAWERCTVGGTVNNCVSYCIAVGKNCTNDCTVPHCAGASGAFNAGNCVSCVTWTWPAGRCTQPWFVVYCCCQ